MATQAQILTNRQNALRSTGPRSVEGKTASRFNALKTGIQAKSQVIPGEDPVEFEELVAGYHRQFPAATPLERFLVDTLARAEWQLRRLQTVEARLWEQSLSAEVPGLGAAYESHLQTFTRLHRRIEALERSYYKALHQIEQLHNEDLAAEEPLPLDTRLGSFGHFTEFDSIQPPVSSPAAPAANLTSPPDIDPGPASGETSLERAKNPGAIERQS